MIRRAASVHALGVAGILLLTWAIAAAQPRLRLQLFLGADPAPVDAGTDPGACALLLPDSDDALSRDCLVCHGRQAHGGHPYDLDYSGSASASRASGLRPLDEAVRRGAFLPDRQIRCVTCHDGRSPWKYNLRLPPGAPLVQAVDLTRPATYENPRVLTGPRPGDDVGRKPLCLTCHALD